MCGRGESKWTRSEKAPPRPGGQEDVREEEEEGGVAGPRNHNFCRRDRIQTIGTCSASRATTIRGTCASSHPLVSQGRTA